MAEYTGKRAQEKQAEAIAKAVSGVDSELTWFGEAVAKSEEFARTGRNEFKWVISKDEFRSDLIKKCEEKKNSCRSSITKLRTLDPNNGAISDFKEQYDELCEKWADIKLQIIGGKKFKKNNNNATNSSTSESNRESRTISAIKAIKEALSDNDNETEQEQNEPSESDLEKKYLEEIHFNSKNAEKLTAQLDKLSNKILTQFLSFSLTGSNFHLAECKFEEGLELLRHIDPNNSMLPIYQERLTKWRDKHKSNIRKRIIAWGIIICSIAAFVLWTELHKN